MTLPSSLQDLGDDENIDQVCAPLHHDGGMVKRSTIGLLFGRDGSACMICGEELEEGDVTVDHIWPVSRGGNNRLENLQLAHQLCNSRRGNDDGVGWRAAHPTMTHLVRPAWHRLPRSGPNPAPERRPPREPRLTQPLWAPSAHELAALHWDHVGLRPDEAE